MSMDEEEIRKLFEDPKPASIDMDVIEQAQPESIQSTIESLSAIVNGDRSLQERLSKSGNVQMTASLLQGDNVREITRYIRELMDALREEAITMRQIVLNDVFLSPSVSRLMRKLPQREELIKEAEKGNLVAVQALLPEPSQTLEKRLREVGQYDRLLRQEFPDLFVQKQSLIFPPSAYADETNEDPADAKEGFVDSVFLRKRMEALGIDPRTGLPSLEQDIENLSSRKNTLAGIIGIVESDVGDSLDEAKQGVEEPSTKSLINIMGIFAYIRSTANFDNLEQTYNAAFSRMNTGFGKIQSLFAWGEISPRAEAAGILGADMTAALSSPDLEAKTKAVHTLMDSQEYAVQELLQQLPDEERETYTQNFSRVSDEVDLARNADDLERVIDSYSSALMMLESDARSQQGIMKRMVYGIQDFFGRSS
ncbi:MAG TPA: hypothetical protein VJB82_01625 [Candidatus Peribacterales bacterium]|nr:hypothetical protein [Candidatus Peribacterales bacterium]